MPGIEIDRKRILTSDEAIHLAEIPKSIAILGSGAVGVEFASIFRRFGSEVTILELLPRLVPVEDEAVSAELQKSFRKQGITSHTGARVTGAAVKGDGVEIDVQLADGTTSSIRADYLLVATGRQSLLRRSNVFPASRKLFDSTAFNQIRVTPCNVKKVFVVTVRVGKKDTAK